MERLTMLLSTSLLVWEIIQYRLCEELIKHHKEKPDEQIIAG
jgi:hypothetical protein